MNDRSQKYQYVFKFRWTEINMQTVNKQTNRKPTDKCVLSMFPNLTRNDRQTDRQTSFIAAWTHEMVNDCYISMLMRTYLQLFFNPELQAEVNSAVQWLSESGCLRPKYNASPDPNDRMTAVDSRHPWKFSLSKTNHKQHSITPHSITPYSMPQHLPAPAVSSFRPLPSADALTERP